MEKKILEEKEEDNGLYRKVEAIETTPEDGFVKSDITIGSTDNYNRYHKGYSKSVVFKTNDPRVIRPFMYTFCALFFIIGLLLLLFNEWFIGIIFTLTSLFFAIKFKKDIDKTEQKLKESGNYKEKLTCEEKETYKKMIKDSLNNVKATTFPRKSFEWYLKISLRIYFVICLIIFLVISVLINIFWGIFILLLLILYGLFYIWLIKKLLKIKSSLNKD